MKLNSIFLVVFILLLFVFSECTNSSSGDNVAEMSNLSALKSFEYITTEQFKEKIFDFEKNKEWIYSGTKPCIVDFYADWCGPCKMLSPILGELSEEYKDKITIYKVNIDKEKDLAQLFNINSIPALLFCPMSGKPSMSNGYIEKSELSKMIKEILLTKK